VHVDSARFRALFAAHDAEAAAVAERIEGVLRDASESRVVSQLARPEPAADGPARRAEPFVRPHA
jgi:hypothetical protein